MKGADCTDDQAALGARVKDLIGQDGYPGTGLHEDERLDRHVRTYLRMLAKITKANEGFEKTFCHR